MKNTQVIVKDIYPIIANGLQKNITKYKRYMGDFISQRSEDLYDTAPARRIYFTDEDRNKYFKTLDVDIKPLEVSLKNTYYGNQANFRPAAAKDITTVAMLSMIRFFYLNKNKYKKELDLALINFAFSGKLYPSIHYSYFQVVQPVKYRHVIDYVVGSMLTDKFALKSQGNVIGAVRSIMETWLSAYDKKFKEFDDEDCVYLIQQIHGRINSFMKNIASLYYEAYKNKEQYINYSTDDYSEDSFRIADNDSTIGQGAINKAVTDVINNNINYKFCKMASSSVVKADEIKAILEYIIKRDTKDLSIVSELVSLLVSTYMSNNKNKDVTSVNFISYSLTPKPNSKDKNYLRIKEIIETWLDGASSRYRRTKSHLSTKNAFVKAILMYFVLVIHYANL